MPDHNDDVFYHAEGPDGGPIYVETNLEHLIAEPFNAVSAALFLGIVAYWFYRIRGQYSRHLFLTITLPVLLMGGVGGTLYHAFRVSQVFLVMDWLPIFLITIAASAYYLFRVLYKWRYVFMVIGGTLLLELINFSIFENRVYSPHTATNVSYAIVGVVILASVGLLLHRMRYQHGRYVLYALVSFAMALLFRTIDPLAITPVGTHFLWHVFGAVACHFMLYYTFCLNEGAHTLEVHRSQNPDLESVPGSAAAHTTNAARPSGYRETQQ